MVRKAKSSNQKSRQKVLKLGSLTIEYLGLSSVAQKENNSGFPEAETWLADSNSFVMISQVGWVQKRYEHSTFARLPVDCRPGGQMCLESSMGIFFPSQLPMLLVGLT